MVVLAHSAAVTCAAVQVPSAGSTEAAQVTFCAEGLMAESAQALVEA